MLMDKGLSVMQSAEPKEQHRLVLVMESRHTWNQDWCASCVPSWPSNHSVQKHVWPRLCFSTKGIDTVSCRLGSMNITLVLTGPACDASDSSTKSAPAEVLVG
jgi:hypothetical protein